MNEFKNNNVVYENELNQSNYYAIALCEAQKLSGEIVNQKDISMTGLQFLMVLIADKLPPNTLPEDKIRIPGYGIRLDSNHKLKFLSKNGGDLVCIVRYKMPKYSKQELDGLKAFAKPNDDTLTEHNNKVDKEVK